jgi:hypothetical protein
VSTRPSLPSASFKSVIAGWGMGMKVQQQPAACRLPPARHHLTSRRPCTQGVERHVTTCDLQELLSAACIAVMLSARHGATGCMRMRLTVRALKLSTAPCLLLSLLPDALGRGHQKRPGCCSVAQAHKAGQAGGWHSSTDRSAHHSQDTHRWAHNQLLYPELQQRWDGLCKWQQVQHNGVQPLLVLLPCQRASVSGNCAVPNLGT